MKRAAVLIAVLAAFAWVAAQNLDPSQQPPPWQEGGSGIQPVIWPVKVTNFPVPQEVVGTVDVGNLPAVQQVAGTVAIDNLPLTSQGSLAVDCTESQDAYQFVGDVFGGPVLVDEVSGPFTLGDFEIDGAKAAYFFFEVAPESASTPAYDTRVFLEGFFDGPPSITIFAQEVAHLRHADPFVCCNISNGLGCQGGSINDMTSEHPATFVNAIGFPSMRYQLRVEQSTDATLSFCPPGKAYDGPPISQEAARVETMSVFIR